MFANKHQIDWGVSGDRFAGNEERQQKKYGIEATPKWIFYYF